MLTTEGLGVLNVWYGTRGNFSAEFAKEINGLIGLQGGCRAAGNGG